MGPSQRTVLAAGGLVIALALGILLATHELGFGARADGSLGFLSWDPVAGHEPSPPGTRPFAFVLEDPSDRKVFEECGRWLPAGLTPYVEVSSYYPQIGTWLMAVPYLLFDHGIDPSAPPARGSPAYQDEIRRNFGPYGDVHHVLMALWLFVLLVLVTSILAELGSSPGWALLLFLPGTLYYAFNRFDLVVTVLVAGALLLTLRRRPYSAAAVLGLAIMTKWYPVVLVPAFLSYQVHSARARRVAAGEPAPWIPLLARHALLPALPIAAVCLLVLSVTWLHDGGGKAAVTALLDYHAKREPNHSSLLAMLTHPLALGWLPMESRGWLRPLMPWVQVLPAALLGCLPLRTPRALILAWLAATLNTVLFSIFFSPQWVVLWAGTLALLLAPRDRWLRVFVVGLGIWIYWQTPLTFYRVVSRGADQPEVWTDTSFWTASYVRCAALILFTAYAFARCLGAALGRPESRPPAAAPSA